MRLARWIAEGLARFAHSFRPIPHPFGLAYARTAAARRLPSGVFHGGRD